MSSSTLQDLRRAIYVRAKADPSWRFWVHICTQETLAAAYQLAKRNNGAPGSDGVSFAAIERGGVDVFLEQLRTELVARSYRPQPVRHVAIPKGGGKTRRLSMPTIRDRVVQGAVKLILEPIFEADFQPGSYGQGVRERFGTIGAGVARGLRLRHDHGSNYLADDFQQEVAFFGIESSPSFVREPEGNGVAERFIRTLKENLLWVRSFDTIEELRLALLAFKRTYNEQWMLEKYHYRSPAQVRRDLVGLDAAA